MVWARWVSNVPSTAAEPSGAGVRTVAISGLWGTSLLLTVDGQMLPLSTGSFSALSFAMLAPEVASRWS